MTTTTAITFSDSEDEKAPQIVLNDSNIYKIILGDIESDIQTRVKALEMYYKQQKDNSAMELLSQLSGMYHFSGTKNIEYFLLRVCTHGNISSLFKVEAAKSLLTYEEDEMGSDSDDEDFAKTHNKLINERNRKRKIAAYKALDCACYDLASLPTPCKIESVCMLMESPDHKKQSASYFIEIITDQDIDCDYRYKTILSLERRVGEDGKVTFEKWNIPDREFFLEKACYAFVRDNENTTMYRILAGQYLLQKLQISAVIMRSVEETLLSFAEDEGEKYNLRADAADTLLSLGESDIKAKARAIIMVLGRAMGEVKTMFDNAQNVHMDEIEKSVAEALEFLSGMPLMEVGEKKIDFAYVNQQIGDLLDEKRKKVLSSGEGDKSCAYCEGYTVDMDEHDGKFFCRDKCFTAYDYADKIQIALNRICVDRILYSKFNQTLVNILLKVWTYLSDHESVDVMKERMLEELFDMSGTCSTGFASRLVNVISGFGDFNMRISWEDQIVANFTGRLNARARNIDEDGSIYFKGDKHKEVVELYMRAHGMLDKRTHAEELESKVSKKDLINAYLEVDGSKKIVEAVEEFAEAVLNEMMIPSSRYDERQNFLKFFRDNMLSLREELYEEFKDLVDDASFDLSFRRAIMIYEGEN